MPLHSMTLLLKLIRVVDATQLQDNLICKNTFSNPNNWFTPVAPTTLSRRSFLSMLGATPEDGNKVFQCDIQDAEYN